ncbi:hypothetical protein LbFV_ORF88 [Leptopilina boulardi filamentous virus]|uniref:Uncharacterized protein n=1 Tax=Leptopilina boulardi filamentous virus TaxID=552509 RepID=A0A1S5YDC8_9VIRU|nr:hypothetical protein LbFV_ORF88 [Leptopilina boulardi filamentous virus]AQQ80008.1 hypothetical protein LbFV_ORF88 [Leptopilina boulardi filamentous virus]
MTKITVEKFFLPQLKEIKEQTIDNEIYNRWCSQEKIMKYPQIYKYEMNLLKKTIKLNKKIVRYNKIIKKLILASQKFNKSIQ